MNFLLHASLHSLEHCAASGKHDVFEQVFPDVFLTLDDSMISVLMDTVLIVFHTFTIPIRWLEEDFGAF